MTSKAKETEVTENEDEKFGESCISALPDDEKLVLGTFSCFDEIIIEKDFTEAYYEWADSTRRSYGCDRAYERIFVNMDNVLEICGWFGIENPQLVVDALEEKQYLIRRKEKLGRGGIIKTIYKVSMKIELDGKRKTRGDFKGYADELLSNEGYDQLRTLQSFLKKGELTHRDDNYSIITSKEGILVQNACLITINPFLVKDENWWENMAEELENKIEQTWKEYLKSKYKKRNLIPFIIIKSKPHCRSYSLVSDIHKIMAISKNRLDTEYANLKKYVDLEEGGQKMDDFLENFNEFCCELFQEEREKQVERLRQFKKGVVYDDDVNPLLTYGHSNCTVIIEHVNIPYIPSPNDNEIKILLLDKIGYEFRTPKVFNEWKNNVVIYCLDRYQSFSIPKWEDDVSSAVQEFEDIYYQVEEKSFEPNEECQELINEVATAKTHLVKLKEQRRENESNESFTDIIPKISKLSKMVEKCISDENNERFRNYKNKIGKYSDGWGIGAGFFFDKNRCDEVKADYHKLVITPEKRELLVKTIRFLEDLISS